MEYSLEIEKKEIIDIYVYEFVKWILIIKINLLKWFINIGIFNFVVF